MGPNTRKRPKGGAQSPPLTHAQVDKLLAAEPSTEQWVIKTQFTSGDTAYWGDKRNGGSGLTPRRSDAHRYVSEEAALHVGYTYKENSWIGPFTVEMIPPKPRLGGGSGTGGRIGSNPSVKHQS